MAGEFELSNVEAELQVRFRYMLVYFAIMPLGLFGGDLIVNLPHGRPLWPGTIGFIAFLAVGVAIALGLGYGAARAIVMLSVPRALSIRDGAIIGDFRRNGWLGAPVQEIRLTDVRLIRRARLLRVPIVFGRKKASRETPIREAPFFYVSDANAELIRAALASNHVS